MAARYEQVPAAVFLTVTETGKYQRIADFLRKGRDEGRWTSLPAVREFVLREIDSAADMDFVRRTMDQMIAWEIVVSDHDNTGVRSLKEINHARTQYQLTAKGAMALRFRDDVNNPETGSLNDRRPRLIHERLLQIRNWVLSVHDLDAVPEARIRDLEALRTEMQDALSGMQNDADLFLDTMESRVSGLTKSIEVDDGTHPLILFREWLQEYTGTFIVQVQRLQTSGSQCMADIRQHSAVQADGTRLGGERILQEALVRGSRIGDLTGSEQANKQAERVIERLRNLVSEAGACRVLEVRALAAWDRYLAAVRRIRTRMGAVSTGSRARLYSAMAAKVAHLPEDEALRMASMITPALLRERMLLLSTFPPVRPGRDAWEQEARWTIELSKPARGNPKFTKTSPIRRKREGDAEALRRRGEMERREAAFWAALLKSGSFDISRLKVGLEEARWLTTALNKGMCNPKRVFRLKNGSAVRIVLSEDPEAVSEIRVRDVGLRLMPAMTLEVGS